MPSHNKLKELKADKEMWDLFCGRSKTKVLHRRAEVSTPQGDTSFMKAFTARENTKPKLNFKLEEKGNTMVEQITTSVKTETLDMAQVTVGKLLFTNGAWLIAKFAPKLTWYEKLFTSKEKRETAVLVGSYIALTMLKPRFSHYVIDALTLYINMELQSKLVGGMTAETLEKIFSKLESK